MQGSYSGLGQAFANGAKSLVPMSSTSFSPHSLISLVYSASNQSNMRTNIITILCLLALRVYGFEEILPTQTLQLESRDESSCDQYHAEARVNNRRVGFLSFNSEGYASVTRDKHAATVLHTDSEGRPRAGKAFLARSPVTPFLTNLDPRPVVNVKTRPHLLGMSKV